MSPGAETGATLTHLDDATRTLVRLSAAVAGGTEAQAREQLQAAATSAPHEWIEELLLQTYLFAGFPRALNAAREWRRLKPQPADARNAAAPLRETGEATCRRVYGAMYDKLRVNIRALHPMLDDWMIEEGYGKVLSRPSLDLPRRELCIVAACAATRQDRQLQSHLHGSRNVGVAEGVIADALASLEGVIRAADLARAQRMWSRIRHDIH